MRNFSFFSISLLLPGDETDILEGGEGASKGVFSRGRDHAKVSLGKAAEEGALLSRSNILPRKEYPEIPICLLLSDCLQG
jgi:hypothetical protein